VTKHSLKIFPVLLILATWCLQVPGALAIALVGDVTKAQKGVIDLSSYDLSSNLIDINGEVRFEWEALVPPNQSQRLTDFYPLPSLWGQFTANGISTNQIGYASYGFDILLPNNFAKSGKMLAFGVAHTYCAYSLFVDGKLIGSNGKVATFAADYIPYWKPQTMSFFPISDTVHVILQISNFDHSKGGIREDLRFGDSDLIEYEFTRDMSFDYILTGCLLMGGLFFLGFYLFGRNDYSLLFFALFCLSYAYRIIGAKNYGLHYLVPNLSWNTAIVLEYLTLYLSGILFIIYSYLLYPLHYKRGMVYFTGGISFLFLLSSILSKPLFFTAILNQYFIVLIFSVVYLLFVYIKAYIAKLEGAIFAILSIAALSFSFSYDILAYFQLVDKNSFIIFFSYLAFFFLQSLILSKRFAATYRNALKRSLEARIAKVDFLSTVSHEIRTPLNAIIGMSNLLVVAPGQAENLSTLKLSAKNLLMLINDILDYTKISTGKIEFDDKPTNILFLINNLIRGFRFRSDLNEGVKLMLVTDPDIPKYVYCDAPRLSQILNNLVGNALKFTEEGTVKVILSLESITPESAKVKFEVEDTGIGIPEDKFTEIFETFTQINTSSTRKHGGTGIGLSITKNLLTLQGSDISVKSQLDEGSTFGFVLDLKIAESELSKYADEVDFENVEKLTGVKVLVVEDNEMNILITKKFLQKWGIEFDIAKNGKQALDAYNNHDLVLMDLQMPIMDGYTATKELRKMGVEVPIIALTASALFDIREKIYESGLDDYIIKPFDPMDFYVKLKSYVRPNSLGEIDSKEE
jgi:signal transduction histidine kinase/CheY-like chemotaxis protein